MFSKKTISLCLIPILFIFFFSISAFSQNNFPTPLGSTEVGQALKNDLNGEGKWNQISFADDTTQTTAGDGGGLGTNLSSTTNDILSDTGIVILGGTDNTNNENLLFDFESDSNDVLVTSTTGVGKIQFKTLTLLVGDNRFYNFGNDTDAQMGWETEGNDNLQLGLSVGDAVFSGYLSIMEKADMGMANRSPLATSADPVLRIYSSDVAEALDYLEFFHDQANPKIQWGNGSLGFDSNAADTTAILSIENTGGDFQIFRDDASPESVITGSIGDLMIDTTGGALYLKNTGSATNTGWVAIGAAIPIYKSYSLANPGSAGTFYIGGHYTAPAADVTLTIGGTVIQVHGTAGEASGTHSFVVASAAGGTDLVLTVTGISIADDGTRTTSDSEILVADTDQAITDQYFETTKKWLGQVTYTLTGSSGAFTFNYGHVKYDDFGNKNFTITDFEVTGLMRANETGLNIELLHHEATAFVYSAAAFSPNVTPLISLGTDYSTDNDVGTGESFSYKRSALSAAVIGGDSEGVIIRVTTVVNNSINHANFHIGVNIN